MATSATLAIMPGEWGCHCLGQDQAERLIAALNRLSTALEQASPPVRQQRGGRRRTGVMARSFVESQLHAGPRPWSAIVAAGREFGHSDRTMRRYRDEVAVHQRTDDGVIVWRLREGTGNG